MLQVRNLTRRFGENVAVDDVSFSIPSGQMTGFVGANGAGKTTTMRMIMGVLTAHAGEILVDGRPITPADRATFGYMPEERGLYPKQPILDQLVYLGQLHRMSQSDARSRAQELLERFQLGGRGKDKLESLSLGNQQRVQIAASLLHRPTALILDEPFSGLDPVAVDSMVDLLREHTAQGVPVLFSSHQLDLVDRLCDNLVVLQKGRLVAAGTGDELRSTAPRRHRLTVAPDAGWLREETGVTVIDVAGQDAVVELENDDAAQRVLAAAMARGSVHEFSRIRPSLSEIYRGGHPMSIDTKSQDVNQQHRPQQSAPSSGAGTQPPWLIVTLREVMVKMKDRGFVIATLVTTALIVAGVVFNAFMANRGDDYTVAVSSDVGQSVVALADEEARNDDGNITFTAEQAGSDDDALAQVRSEDADAALLQDADGTWILTGKTEVDSGLSRAISASLEGYVLASNAADAGIAPEALLEGSTLEESLLEGNAENQMIASITGFVFSFLFYMASIIFGMTIANSVVEEKQNRVVEILATAIPIRQLLYGKVLGNTVLAMMQLALYGGAALLVLNITGTAEMAGSIIPASGWFLVFFLFGFLILAAMWAVLGSLASRTEDLNSSSTPVMGVIFAALFVGLFAKGQFLVIASYVPVVSSVAMPIRLLNSEVAVWEPILSLIVALAAAVALLHLGEKVYRRAVMQGGGALTLRKALKLEQ